MSSTRKSVGASKLPNLSSEPIRVGKLLLAAQLER